MGDQMSVLLTEVLCGVHTQNQDEIHKNGDPLQRKDSWSRGTQQDLGALFSGVPLVCPETRQS